MDGLGSVQNKVSCVFETTVLDEQSRKRDGQFYKVVASDIIKERAIQSDIHNAKATEKLDGTCVLIASFKEKPWLWARYDRKPNKNAERRFRKYQLEKEKSGSKENDFVWNMTKDFKETPPCWFPASGVKVVDGTPVPDDIGHTPGWVPVSPTARQYCWHLSAVDLGQGLALVLRLETPPCWFPASGVKVVDGTPVPDDIGHTPGWVPVSPTARQYCWHLSAVDLGQGLALVLRLETPSCWFPASGVKIVDGTPVPDDIGHTPGWVPVSPTARQYCWHLSAVDLGQGLALVLRESEGSDHLFIDCIPLSELEGHTAELIGTNINGNPYGLGSKKHPIHLLVVHGSIQIRNPPQIDRCGIEQWFKTDGKVEGIVWHCGNGSLFKVHRNHVMMSWPITEPSLSYRPVEVLVNTTKYENEFENTMFLDLGKVCGCQCENLRELGQLVNPNVEGETITDVKGTATDVRETISDIKGTSTDIKGAGDNVCVGANDGVIDCEKAGSES